MPGGRMLVLTDEEADMALAAWCSEVGTTRDVNQDACAILVANTPVGEVSMALVCDGVGGLSRGEVASASLASALATWFERDLPGLLGLAEAPLDLASVRASWKALLGRAHEAIGAYGRRRGIALATTCTVLLVHAGAYVVGHVGDCRAYVLRAGDAVRMTEDQAQPSASGGGTLTQAIGAGLALRPAFYEGTLAPGDVVVLCSDGAYRRIGGHGLAEAFRGVDTCDEGVLGRAARRVVESCMRAGETDNLTIVCLVPQVPPSARSTRVRGACREWDVASCDAETCEDELETLSGDASLAYGAGAGR